MNLNKPIMTVHLQCSDEITITIINMGRKFRRGLGSYLTQCGHAGAYRHTKFHLDPSNCLATIGMGRKWGGAAVRAGSPLGPHLTQCGLGRGLPLYQVASWSIQPFGHNCKNVRLLRIGIRLRAIFIPSLVVKTFTGCVHWVIARYQLKSSKQCFRTIRETFLIVGNLHVNFTIVVYSPTNILPSYFIPFLNSHIFAIAILR